MSHKLFVLTFCIICMSCAKKTAEIDEKSVVQDTAKVQVVGADRDAHNCITSAGYTWSILKNDCVRIFDVGIRLNAVEENTMGAFIILDDTSNKAELFTIMLKSPIILVRKESEQLWVNGEWELSSEKSYTLKKGGKILFVGQ